MKLVSYVEQTGGGDLPPIRLGALIDGDCVVDLHVAQTWAQGARGFRAREIPGSMLGLLRAWPDIFPHLQALLGAIAGEECLQLRGAGRQPVGRRRADVFLLPPLPNVLSLRVFMSFERHARNLFRSFTQAFPRAWSTLPAFYYANPLTLLGPDQALMAPRQDAALDYELGIACVIARQGQDIPVEEAADYIAGYTIINDWTLRTLQRDEMSIGLGPAKCKDFATTFGPALVTPDELADCQIDQGAGPRFDLTASARLNSVEKTRSNLKEMHWSFAHMIAHTSRDMILYPGEMLASGAVDGGSLLDGGADDSGDWLKPGDTLVLEVERLGRLETSILPAE